MTRRRSSTFLQRYNIMGQAAIMADDHKGHGVPLAALLLDERVCKRLANGLICLDPFGRPIIALPPVAAPSATFWLLGAPRGTDGNVARGGRRRRDVGNPGAAGWCFGPIGRRCRSISASILATGARSAV